MTLRYSATLIVFCLCGCMDYVPSAEMLRSPCSPSSAFHVEAAEFQGIYGNSDVDSVIYAYRTRDPEAFWDKLGRQAEDNGWEHVEMHEDYRRYARIVPRLEQQVFHSVEEVRVAMLEDSRVVVAWGQSDQKNLPKRFSRSGPEGNFAEEVLWPKFAEQLRGGRPR